MAADPHMPAANPIPVAAGPDIAGIRRHADDFDARRRRCEHDDPARIVSLIGDNHASGQSHAEHEAEKGSCDYGLAVIHDLFQFYEER